MCSVQCEVCTVQCAVLIVQVCFQGAGVQCLILQYAVCSVQYVVYSVNCVVCSLQYAVYTLLFCVILQKVIKKMNTVTVTQILFFSFFFTILFYKNMRKKIDNIALNFQQKNYIQKLTFIYF